MGQHPDLWRMSNWDGSKSNFKHPQASIIAGLLVKVLEMTIFSTFVLDILCIPDFEVFEHGFPV
jgi:hypothetical protein